MGQGRPKGGKNRKHSFEEKLRIVNLSINDHLSYSKIEQIEGINDSNVSRWVKAYVENGEDGLKAMDNAHVGNRYSALTNSKSLSEEERLRLENMKLKIENERLKKGYLVEGDGANKEYVSTYKKSMKSSKN